MQKAGVSYRRRQKPSSLLLKVKSIRRIQKGFMKEEAASIPYSRESLEDLAETLKIHRSMVWVDHPTSAISGKQILTSQPQAKLGKKR